MPAPQFMSCSTTGLKHPTGDCLLSDMAVADLVRMSLDGEVQAFGPLASGAFLMENRSIAGFMAQKRGTESVLLLPTPLNTGLLTTLPVRLQ